MVFAVTGHTEAIYTEKALNSGMNLVLFKPVDGQLLKQLVGQIGFVEEKFDENLQREDDSSMVLLESNDEDKEEGNPPESLEELERGDSNWLLKTCDIRDDDFGENSA